MKIYIASRTASWEEVQVLRDIARSYGHEITHDWTIPISQSGRQGSDGIIDHERFSRIARTDMAGVAFCDLHILIARPDLCGSLIETGMALAWSKRVWVIDIHMMKLTVFLSLPKVEFKTWNEAVKELELAGSVV